jgi:hypothetical protein
MNPIIYNKDNTGYSVTYRSPSRKFGNLRDELNKDALKINKEYGPVYVGFSSGVDSQVILRCFLDMKCDFIPFFVHIKEYNDFEYDMVLKSEKFYKNYIVALKSFKDTQWGAHWLTAIEISKDNLLFGSGIRTFRIVCKEYDNIDSLRKDSRCSTHPHNIYLEILSETGTIGFILILLFFFSFLKNFIIKSKNNNNLTIAIGALILAVIFPLKPTGAFFSSWYGSILWYLLGYYYFSLKCLDKQK